MAKPIKARYATDAEPVWLVWEHDGNRDEEDAREVQAHEADDAAEAYAEAADSEGEYLFLDSGGVEVRVRRKGGDGPPLRFTVWGESVPTYRTRAVTT